MADAQTTIVSASGTGGAGLVATNPGTATSTVVSAGASSGAECVSGSVFFNPPLSVDLTDATLIDGVTGVVLPPAQGFAKTGQHNLRALGKPHFAFTHTEGAAVLPIGELGIGGTFMLHRLPTALASAEEVHWLFSLHETAPDGLEIVAVGVTPSGRFAFSSRDVGTTFSAGGAVPVDGLFHYIRLNSYGGCLQVFLDGVGILNSILTVIRSQYPTTGAGVRFCLFNGRDGASVLDCSVANFEVSAEEGAIVWPITEGHGDTISDYGLGDWNLDLEATWFNGVPIGACPEFPSLPLTSAYTWGRATAWTPRPPYSPTYTKVVSP